MPAGVIKKSAAKAGVKRPQSSYFIFMNEERANIKAANPDCKVTEIGKIAGKMWAEMEPKQKKVYQDKAAVLKAAYLKELED